MVPHIEIDFDDALHHLTSLGVFLALLRSSSAAGRAPFLGGGSKGPGFWGVWQRRSPLLGGRGEAAAVAEVHQEAVELLRAAVRPRLHLLRRLNVDVCHEHADADGVERRRHVVRHPRPPATTFIA